MAIDLLKYMIWKNGTGGGGASYEKTVGPAPIISIADAKAKPAKSLIVGMEPIQAGSGDPSPDNIRPISGRTGVTVERTGKNLDPYNDLNHTTRLWGSNSNEQKAVFRALPIGTYTMSCKFTVLTNPNAEETVDIGVLVRYQNGQGGYVTIIPYILTPKPATVGAVYEWSKSFTLTESIADKDSLSVYFYCASGGTSLITANAYDIQIESGDVATPTYEPYVGETYPVVFPDSVGTVYGGTVDLVSGELTATMASVTIDSTRIIMDSGTRYHVAKTYIGDVLTSGASLMNKFRIRASSEGYAVAGTYFIDINNLQMNAYQSFATKEEFLAAYGELQLAYTLSTPQTYQLTPTQIQLLKGENVLWSDADDLTLTYLGTTPPNLLGGMLGGGLGNPQESTEETSEEPQE